MPPMAQNGQAHAGHRLRRVGARDHGAAPREWLGQVDVRCLPAELHNRPERIPAAVRALDPGFARPYQSIFVAYGDCGTGGLLDAVLARRASSASRARIATSSSRPDLSLRRACRGRARHVLSHGFSAAAFRSLVIRGLGLDRHPELLPSYFGNYRKLVYLAQAPKPASLERGAGDRGAHGTRIRVSRDRLRRRSRAARRRRGAARERQPAPGAAA